MAPDSVAMVICAATTAGTKRVATVATQSESERVMRLLAVAWRRSIAAGPPMHARIAHGHRTSHSEKGDIESRAGRWCGPAQMRGSYRRAVGSPQERRHVAQVRGARGSGGEYILPTVQQQSRPLKYLQFSGDPRGTFENCAIYRYWCLVV